MASRVPRGVEGALAASRASRQALKRAVPGSTRVRSYATVGDQASSDILNSVKASSSSGGRTPLQERQVQSASPQERKSAIEAEKERKYRQYEALLKAKAKEEGVTSVEELAAKRKAQRDASISAALGLKPPPPTASSSIEQRDADLAARIRAAAEKEAKRKLESGELSSNPNGDKSPIKPLSSILDLSKIEGNEEMDATRIQELWTGYHSMKGKLSAVIPTQTYERLLSAAKQYPQFVLPLPRTIVGGDEQGSPADEGDVKASGLQPGEKKQGYEMQFMEWGFLPAPLAAAEAKVPPPTTVLFTPLAEYKLRQEFAQPLLVLTHYTDLAKSKGIVLMRGDVTSSEEIEANPTGIAAAEAAKARGASEEEQQKLKTTPVQATTTTTKEGQGSSRMSEKDAQLLAMTMQRFYLPHPDGNRGDVHAAERQKLLEAFHSDKDSFSVQKLCDVAFAF